MATLIIFFLNIINSFRLYKLDLQREYQMLSIEHKSGAGFVIWCRLC